MEQKYINSCLNYTGSKFKLLDQILVEMDYKKEYFIDLFCGSGVVGFNVIDKYKKILINDIIKNLVEIHKEIINNPIIFIDKVKSLVVSKDDQDGFNELRKNYNDENSPEGLYSLLLCCNNNALRFNQKGKFNQTFGRRTFSDSTQKKLDEFIKHISKYSEKIFYSNNNFYKINPTKPSMIYCDPPYGYCMDNNGNITNKQVSEAGYNSTWSQKDDIELYNYILKLDKNKQSFMLSGVIEHDNKKSWLINKLLQNKFNYKKLNYNYNGISHKGDKETNEVIIFNY